MTQPYAYVRFVTKDNRSAQRLAYYFDSKTRPQNEAYVALPEKNLCNKLNWLRPSTRISWKHDTAINVEFDPVEEIALEDIFETLKPFGIADIFVYYDEDENYKMYKQIRNGKHTKLYQPHDDEAVDAKLWQLGWDMRAFDYIIERFGLEPETKEVNNQNIIPLKRSNVN